MKTSLSDFKFRITGVLIAVLICLADQWSKGAMKAFLESKPGRTVTLVHNHVDLVYRFNTGGAFSMLDNHPKIFLYLPSALIILILMLIFMSKDRKNELPGILGLGCILGGALGNMVDRIQHPGRGVFDFVDCYIGQLHWPAFNLADSCIVLGVFVFAVTILRSELRHGR